MFPTYSPQGCGVQPRGLVPNFLLRLKSFCVASPWARLTEVLCWLSIRVTPIGKAREISPYVGQTLAWPTVHLKKLLVLCRRRVRKGSWCRDLTLASRLSAQLIWARCTGACFLPVRSPCAPRMHFWACLEICDHHLSRSRETKYTGEKNKIKQINKKNPTPPPPPPLQNGFCAAKSTCVLGKTSLWGALLSVLAALFSLLLHIHRTAFSWAAFTHWRLAGHLNGCRAYVHDALTTAPVLRSVAQPCLGNCLHTAAGLDWQASKDAFSWAEHFKTPWGTVFCLPKLICKSKQHESATGHCSSPVFFLLLPAAWILCLEHHSFPIPHLSTGRLSSRSHSFSSYE